MKDDAIVVAEALENGPEAFAPIITRYKDAVFGVALARVRNFHDAEDVTQGVFLEAFERLDRLKDPNRLGAWLRSIAIHRSLNYLRGRGRSVDLEVVAETVTDGRTPQIYATGPGNEVLCASRRDGPALGGKAHILSP
ncbi:MAG: sigma factor, partial [bacterium]|nr:sigma factor [bacterium]